MKKYDVIVLDEFTYLFKFGLIDKKEVIKSLINKPSNVEIIITGRYADKDLKKISDLISVIKKQKHYFDKKIFARKGIEY
jgi:cob(I)alamin adenosyltransferase